MMHKPIIQTDHPACRPDAQWDGPVTSNNPGQARFRSVHVGKQTLGTRAGGWRWVEFTSNGLARTREDSPRVGTPALECTVRLVAESLEGAYRMSGHCYTGQEVVDSPDGTGHRTDPVEGDNHPLVDVEVSDIELGRRNTLDEGSGPDSRIRLRLRLHGDSTHEAVLVVHSHQRRLAAGGGHQATTSVLVLVVVCQAEAVSQC